MGSRVFVVGVGRSGTSLMQSVLGSHPEVYPLKETALLRNCIFSGKHVAATKLHRISALEKLITTSGSLSVSNILARYCEYTDNFSNKYVLDKDPRLVEFVDHLRVIFPREKIVCMLRDPRDVLLSKKKATWSKGKLSLMNIFASAVHIRYTKMCSADSNVFVVRYEDFVNDQLNSCKEISRFLELPFHDQMLEHTETAQSLIEDDEYDWKKETLGTVSQSKNGKWRNELNSWEIRLAYQIVKPELRGYGYSSVDNVSIPVKLLCVPAVFFLRLSVTFFMIFNRLRFLYWKYTVRF